MGQKIKLTKAVIDKLPIPLPPKRIDYFDAELKGFGIRVSSNSRRFFVLRRVNGRLTRIMLKPYGLCTPDEARYEANKTISKLYDGIDVNKERAKAKVRGMTLADALKRYFETKTLKPRTVSTYDDLFRLYLDDWLKKPIAEITKDMVAARHSRVSQSNGEAAANNVMRTLKAVYNFANELHDNELPTNPVRRLDSTDQWNRIERRESVIEPEHLPGVFQAIQELPNPTIKDYLLSATTSWTKKGAMTS